MEQAAGLTPEQDAHLRRLHYFEQVGAKLSPEFVELLQELKRVYRIQDRRRVIREPDADVLFLVQVRGGPAPQGSCRDPQAFPSPPRLVAQSRSSATSTAWRALSHHLPKAIA